MKHLDMVERYFWNVVNHHWGEELRLLVKTVKIDVILNKLFSCTLNHHAWKPSCLKKQERLWNTFLNYCYCFLFFMCIWEELLAKFSFLIRLFNLYRAFSTVLVFGQNKIHTFVSSAQTRLTFTFLYIRCNLWARKTFTMV